MYDLEYVAIFMYSIAFAHVSGRFNPIQILSFIGMIILIRQPVNRKPMQKWNSKEPWLH